MVSSIFYHDFLFGTFLGVLYFLVPFDTFWYNLVILGTFLFGALWFQDVLVAVALEYCQIQSSVIISIVDLLPWCTRNGT